MRCFGHVASRAVSALRALAASVFSDSPGDANAPKGGLMTTPRLDRDAVRAALLEQLPAFVRAYAAPDTPVRELRGEIRVGRKGSLSIVRANGVFFDHESGCGGDVFELACKLTGARGFPEALSRIADFTGTVATSPIPPSSRFCASARPKSRPKSRDTRAVARRIWNATRPLTGTPAEAYLNARGIGHVASAAALRAHPALSHPVERGAFPALVAGVQDVSGTFLGIHRTYLAARGAGKANADPPRASLGSIAGGAVRLAEPGAGRLLVGEGIESTAAAMALFDLPGWATLGTSGLRAIALPDDVLDVVIAADRDGAGL